MAAAPLKVIIAVYEGFNSLDVGGPLDVLCNFALRPPNGEGPSPFNITITAQTECTTAYEFLTVKSDSTFDEAIPDIEAGNYDVLMVPGAGPGAGDAAIKSTQIISLIHAFMGSKSKSGRKWIVSICTGALILGAAGVFKDLDVTTHWAALPNLKEICPPDAQPKSITRKRWVDGGIMKAAAPAQVQGTSGKPGANTPVSTETRVVSSGGISCCLDCSLWLVAQTLGLQSALDTAQMMDYNWNIEWTTLLGVDGNTAPNPF